MGIFRSVVGKALSLLCFLIGFVSQPFIFHKLLEKGVFNALFVNVISGPSESLEMDLSFMFSEMLLSQNHMSRIFFPS